MPGRASTLARALPGRRPLTAYCRRERHALWGGGWAVGARPLDVRPSERRRVLDEVDQRARTGGWSHGPRTEQDQPLQPPLAARTPPAAYFAEKPLDAITVEDVDEYRRRKVAAGRLSPSSVNALITPLAAILAQAVEYDLIAKKAPRSRRNRAAARAPHSPLIKENLRVHPRRPRQRSYLRDGPTRAHRPPPDPAHLLAPEAPPRASASDSNRSSRVRVGHPRAPGPIQRPPQPSRRLASDAPMPRICGAFGSGRSRTRTWDLFLIREAL